MTNLPAETRSLRRLSPIRILILVLVSLSLGGCSVVNGIVPPGAFTHVDAAAEALDLKTVGEIRSEGTRGGGWWFDGDPTYIAVVSGAEALTVIEARLTDQGFAKVDSDFDSTYWKRGSGQEGLHITLRALEPGDTVEVGDGGTISAEEAGAAVTIRGV